MESFKTHRAQTAAELAIFGAILIFVIGLIVRSAMGASQSMNQQLKAMRTAMTQSYLSSIARGGSGKTSRNAANILILEDRLSVDPNNKLGTRDRFPLVVRGSATFSNQLFQPIKYNEVKNLALFDVIINGQHFPFTTAGFREIPLSPTTDGQVGGPPNPKWTEVWGPAGHPNWEEDCYSFIYDAPLDPITNIDPPPITMEGGCVLAYRVVGNFEGSTEWCNCDASAAPGPDECDDSGFRVGGQDFSEPCTENLPASDRFDLDRYHKYDKDTFGNPVLNPGWGITDVLSDTPDPLDNQVSLRKSFSWQWIAAPSLQKKNSEGGTYPAWQNHKLTDSSGTRPLLLTEPIKKDSIYDVDGDGKEEIIYGSGDACVNPISGVMTCVRVADSQMGDINSTIDDRETSEPNFKPSGLQEDMQMLSFTKGITGGPAGNLTGTYLLVEEGKLFDPVSGRFIRNTNRQNHVDIIQRIFRLNRDTDRFCDASSSRVPKVSGVDNPVEICNNCFAPENVTKTCMDEEQKLIFIRSRIADLRGRRWVTKSEFP